MIRTASASSPRGVPRRTSAHSKLQSRHHSQGPPPPASGRRGHQAAVPFSLGLGRPGTGTTASTGAAVPPPPPRPSTREVPFRTRPAPPSTAPAEATRSNPAGRRHTTGSDDFGGASTAVPSMFMPPLRPGGPLGNAGSPSTANGGFGAGGLGGPSSPFLPSQSVNRAGTAQGRTRRAVSSGAPPNRSSFTASAPTRELSKRQQTQSLLSALQGVLKHQRQTGQAVGTLPSVATPPPESPPGGSTDASPLPSSPAFQSGTAPESPRSNDKATAANASTASSDSVDFTARRPPRPQTTDVSPPLSKTDASMRNAAAASGLHRPATGGVGRPNRSAPSTSASASGSKAPRLPSTTEELPLPKPSFLGRKGSAAFTDAATVERPSSVQTPAPQAPATPVGPDRSPLAARSSVLSPDGALNVGTSNWTPTHQQRNGRSQVHSSAGKPRGFSQPTPWARDRTVAPNPHLEKEVNDHGTTEAPSSRPNSGRMHRPHSMSDPSVPPSVEEAIRQRKAQWAQNQWAQRHKKQRADEEEALASGRGVHCGPGALPLPMSRPGTEHGMGGAQGSATFGVGGYDSLGSALRGSPAVRLFASGQEAMGALNSSSFGKQLTPSQRSQIDDVETAEAAARREILVAAERIRRRIMKDIGRAASPPVISTDELRVQGNELYKGGRYGAAHRRYSEALQSQPQNAVLLLNRAATSMMLFNYDACARDCLTAIQIAPHNWKAYARLGRAYVLLGKTSDANDAYTAARRRCTDEAEPALLSEAEAVSWVARARAETESGSMLSALESLKRVGPFAADGPIRSLRWRALIETDPSAARAETTRYIATLPQLQDLCDSSSSTSPSLDAVGSNGNFENNRRDASGREPLFGLGSRKRSAVDKNGVPASMQTLLAAVAEHHADVWLLSARASFHCGLHFADISDTAVTKALSIRPSHSAAVTFARNLGTIVKEVKEARHLFEEGHHASAHSAWSTAVSLCDGSHTGKVKASLLLGRAAAAIALDRFSDAVDDTTAVLAFDSGSLQALRLRSQGREGTGNMLAALADLERACEVDHDLAEDVIQLRMRMAAKGHRDVPPQHDFGGAFNPRTGSSYAHGKRAHQNQGNQQRPATAAANPGPTLYEALGVHRSASTQQVKAQYRRLTLQLHPDKVLQRPDAEREQCERRFKEVAHAYSVLSDAQSRRNYDLTLPA